MNAEKSARHVREEFDGIELYILNELVDWALETGENPFDAGVNVGADARNRLNVAMKRATRKAEDEVAQAYKDGYARDKKASKLVLAALALAVTTRSWNAFNSAGKEALEKVRQGMTNAAQTSLFALQRAKLDAVNKAADIFTKGGVTWMEAKQAALNALADRGVTNFVDKAGRTWELDSYVDMCVRTASANANRAAFDTAMEARNVDLVFVSSHMGSCPKCAPLQGQVLSRSGNDNHYMSVQEAMNSGLFHPNCGHVLFEYIKGYSTLRNDDTSTSTELYKNTQRQRGYERNIRKWMRREVAALTPEEKKKAKEQVKFWRGEIANFTRDKGLKRDTYRERPWDI